jgi:two-component system chemotaxis response regulator CheY
MKRVLSVGNCGYDHGALSALLARAFQAETVAAHSAAEALGAARSEKYDLILVNRVLDADGSDGLAIIESLQNDPATKDMPVMMITNFAEHQAAALCAGAQPGFGKQTLHDAETRRRLEAFLG